MRSVASVVVVLAGCLAGHGPARAQSQPTPEEKVALHFFKDGRSQYDAGQYPEALASFEKAFELAQNDYLRYYLGLTHARLGACEKAVQRLHEITSRLPALAERERQRVETTCLETLAKGALEARDCSRALPFLEQLKGKLKGQAAAWRDDEARRCEGGTADFPLDTPNRRAAYDLLLAARQDATAGNLQKGVERFKLALRFADEPVIRRELAGLEAKQSGCDPARSTLEGLPTSARTPEESRLIETCREYAPHLEVVGTDLYTYASVVHSGLEALRAGKQQVAATLLAPWMPKTSAAGLWALYLDAVFEGAGCEAWRAALGIAPEAGRRAAKEVEARAAKCAVVADPGLEPKVGVTELPPITVGPLTDETTMEGATGWAMLALGAAGMGTGVVFLGLTDLEFRNIEKAKQDRTDATTQAAVTAAEKRAMAAAERHYQDQIIGYVVGGVGIAALVAGILLLTLPGDPPSPDAGPGGLTFRF
jgi:hypothetical protein